MTIAQLQLPVHPAPLAPILSVCMICKREIGPGHSRTGEPLPPAPNHSHGVCRECLPAYGRTMGMSAERISRMLASLN